LNLGRFDEMPIEEKQMLISPVSSPRRKAVRLPNALDHKILGLEKEEIKLEIKEE